MLTIKSAPLKFQRHTLFIYTVILLYIIHAMVVHIIKKLFAMMLFFLLYKLKYTI